MRDLLRRASGVSVGGAGGALLSALATFALAASLTPIGAAASASDSHPDAQDESSSAVTMARDDLARVAESTALGVDDAGGDVTEDAADPDGEPRVDSPRGAVDAPGAQRAAPYAVPGGVVGFEAGNIISDAVFTNKATMTATQISAFIDSKVAACQATYVCLEDFVQTTTTRAADAYCAQYPGGAKESAARIISKVSQACGINPQVLLVMLQKEQGLVTHDWPSTFRFTRAMGMGCPDNAECDKRFEGFFNQVYGAARQMKIYSTETDSFSWYAPGATHEILYNPDRSCGTAPVYIRNQATANLYYYTPYQPNAAALAAGAGDGDDCSSYGNRNFYTLFRAWFETTGGGSAPATYTPGVPTVTGTAAVGRTLTAFPGDWTWRTAFGYQWLRDGAPISGATAPAYVLRAADLGKKIAIRVTGSLAGHTAVTKTSAAKSVARGTLSAPTPAVTGTAKVGQLLTAKPGTWTAGTRLTYQWLRDGRSITKATLSRYRPTAADLGRKITVRVTGTLPGYATASKTAAAKTVARGTLVASTPTISGTAKAGKPLTAKPGSWTPGTKRTYQWLRDGRPITGATGSRYTLKTVDAGKRVAVRVTGSLAGYATVTKTSAAKTIAR
ncbi:hypothetical protein [Microbacterium sp.]|uniref:hypothetical protein n=1 Tax=Microbacterium sp. TaxID=51671 RepID=UPI0028127EEF|nr:hypothetical protein [Microbacterium sp.]